MRPAGYCNYSTAWKRQDSGVRRPTTLSLPGDKVIVSLTHERLTWVPLCGIQTREDHHRPDH